MVATDCPSLDELEHYLLGQVAEAEATRVDDHMAQCPTCLVAAADAERRSTDPLFETVRRVAGETVLSALLHDASSIERLDRIAQHAETEVTVFRLFPQRESPSSRIAQRTATEVTGPPGERIGSYRIERVLGRGGMGIVYLARHDRLNRPVALKVLPAHASADRITRFRREAEVIAALRHPNIVQMFEIGDHDGQPFLVMEYVPGGSLGEKLAVAPLRPTEAARLIETIARALAAAHRQGVIHRDLKPANLLLDPPDGPKVADFGLAKFREPDPAAGFETDTGVVLGTPGYMAPEQIDGGNDVGPRADVYGLGAVLYECLTGRPPFKAASVLETLDQVRTLDPVPPRQLEPAVPRDLETICLKCLEKDPARRYPSADDLAEDIGRFLRGEPVSARPVGLARRTWKWACRRPTTAALLAACAIALAALAAVTAIYTAQLQVEVDRANASADEARRQEDRANANAVDARQQQARAANNYRSARDTLRRMLQRLETRRAGDIPRLKELRQDQLEDALTFYQGILAAPDDPDPEVRLDAALARTELGGIHYELGRPGPAGDEIRLALGVLESLPAEFRTRSDCRAGSITCCNYLANMALAEGRVDEGERLHRKALAKAEELVAADPDRNETLAQVEHNLGALFQLTDRRSEAEPHYLRAIAIRTASIERHPKADLHRAGLAGTLLNLGLIQLQTERYQLAATTFRKAEGYLLPLVEANPGDDGYALALAGVYINWAHLLRYTSIDVGAVAMYSRAVVLADAVVVREPRYTTARQRSLEAHGARAVMLEQVGRFVEGVADWNRVVEMADAAARPGYRVRRAAQMVRAKMHVPAVAEAYELARAPELSASERFNVACVLAAGVKPARTDPTFGVLAGLTAGEGHAVAAIRILRDLRNSGYFGQPDRLKWLNENTDLVTLRTRSDFQRLLADAASPPKP